MCNCFIVFVSLVVGVGLDYKTWEGICDEREGDCNVGFEGQLGFRSAEKQSLEVEETF